MIYVDCPRCGSEEALEFRVAYDGDDYRSWQYAEMEKQTCACDLTGEEHDRAQEIADQKAAEYVDEPDFYP